MNVKRLLFLLLFFSGFVYSTSSIESRESGEYCIESNGWLIEKKDMWVVDVFTNAKSRKLDPKKTESVILLPVEYQTCDLNTIKVNANLHIHESFILKGDYTRTGFSFCTATRDSCSISKERLSISDVEVFRFDNASTLNSAKVVVRDHCDEAAFHSDTLPNNNHELDGQILRILKESTGEIFMVEVEVLLQCAIDLVEPSDTLLLPILSSLPNTYFTSGLVKKLKYSYPIKIIGECSADSVFQIK
ncbi:MAG: hypothetical protein LBR60_01535 [Fibrobacter sp.]|jgi:hypothetical protein|nr:hypothetical protein [Fibrobacter sp.]